MVLPYLSTKSRKTSKSKISNKYLKPFPRNNTLKSVALAVALSVYDVRQRSREPHIPSFTHLVKYINKFPGHRLQ